MQLVASRTFFGLDRRHDHPRLLNHVLGGLGQVRLDLLGLGVEPLVPAPALLHDHPGLLLRLLLVLGRGRVVVQGLVASAQFPVLGVEPALPVLIRGGVFAALGGQPLSLSQGLVGPVDVALALAPCVLDARQLGLGGS